MPQPEIAELHVYPVKSARGISLAQAELDQFGLRHDRRFMLVEAASGAFVSQRTVPGLALVGVRIEGDTLLIDAPGERTLPVPLGGHTGASRSVSLWNWDEMPLHGVDQGEGPAAWFSRVLGREVRLVYSADDTPRATQPTPRGLGGRVTFSDGFPLLVASVESLAELNRRLPAPVPMDRFRPNIVVRGVEPFGEDAWAEFTINGIPFRGTKPCARCAITTVDQATGERGVEPLRTLATFRQRDGKVLFGQNAEHAAPGRIAVGDVIVPGVRSAAGVA